jgi:hypothetical protein
LPRKYEALGSIPTNTKEREERKRKKEGRKEGERKKEERKEGGRERTLSEPILT